MQLFECVVTDCWETWQHSLHFTRAGAYKSGRKWLLNRYADQIEANRLLGKGLRDLKTDHQKFRVRTVFVEQ